MNKFKRLALFVLTMLPIASVSFAAQSALGIAQIGKPGISGLDLAGNGSDSLK